MSNAEDDNSKEGASSPPSAEPQPRKTMMGMSLRPPRVPDGASRPGPPPLPPKLGPPPRPRADEPDEFPDEKTQMAGHVRNALIDDELEVDARAEVDAGWDDAFPDEATQVGESPFGRPPAAVSEDVATTSAMSSEWVQSQGFDTDAVDDGGELDATGAWGAEVPSGGGLAEDSLPEPIRERTPTIDELPAQLRPSSSGTMQGIPNPDGSQGGLVAYRGDNATLDDVEFQGEKTEVLDSPFRSDPAVAKLVSLEGPASGQEFFAAALRNTVGRGTNNSIVVPDLAMSRQHFEIARNPDDSFALIDLQSVNGTTLNGTKVREADLFHGDRIEAGKSSFQFVVTGDMVPQTRQRRVIPAATSTLGGGQPMPVPVAAAHPAQASSINRLLLVISAAAVLISLLLMVVIAMLKLNKGDEEATTGPDAAAVYMLGVEAVKSRNWDQAEAQFQRAQTLDAQLDGVEGQLRRIEIEREAAAAVDKARELLDRDLHDEAVKRVEEIPRDSVYFAEAQDLIREGRKSEIVSLYEDAQQAVTDENVAQAQRLVALILEKVPTHQGALTLQEKLAGMEPIEEVDAGVTIEEPVVATTTPRSTASKKSDDDDDWGFDLVDKKKSGSSKPKSGAVRVPNLTQGFMLYRTKKFDAAQAFFDEQADAGGPASKSADKIARAVQEFRENYPAGIAASKAGNWADAERKLVAAKRADSVVGDYFDADIKTKLATAEANLGLDQLSRSNAVAARKLYDRARGHNASDSTVAKLEKELENEARSLYVKANDVKKSDPAKAAKLCRQIKAIVPASNETHQQAAKLLKSL